MDNEKKKISLEVRKILKEKLAENEALVRLIRKLREEGEDGKGTNNNQK
jgi:hypothetical protein